MSLEHLKNVFIWQLLLTVKSLTKLEADTELSTVNLLVSNDEVIIFQPVAVNESEFSDIDMQSLADVLTKLKNLMTFA